MMEWQPIETAPKDGSRILVCVVYEVDEERHFHEWIDFWWKNRWDRFAFEIPAPFPATHWMPLPEAPKP